MRKGGQRRKRDDDQIDDMKENQNQKKMKKLKKMREGMKYEVDDMKDRYEDSVYGD